MNHLPHLPIRRKLVAMLAIVGLLATTLATVAFVRQEQRDLTLDTRNHISAMARVVGSNASAALLFDDPETGTALLASLHEDPEVILAEIIDPQGHVFARYQRQNQGVLALEIIDISEPILSSDQSIGSIHLQVHPAHLQLAIEQATQTAAMTAAAIIVLVLLLAALLQRWISRPLLQLASTMQQVRAGNDYTQKSSIRSEDEIGQLAADFNAMLTQIESRDRALAEQRDRLEETVNLRTRELIEANLQLSSEISERLLFVNALQQAREAILIFDESGRIFYANESYLRISGFERQDVLGKHLHEMRSGEYNQAFFDGIWHQVRQTGSWSGPLWNRSKSGRNYRTRLSISRIEAPGQVKPAYLGLFGDEVGEEHSLQEQLRQAQKMEAIGTLVGGIAHDFNNVLSGIVLSLSTLQRQLPDHPQTQERLEGLLCNCHRAADIIKQLLIFARKDSVEMRILPLNALVKETIKLARLTVPESIRLDLQIADEPLLVEANAGQIQQVLMNLLINARDAVANVEEAKISISLAPARNSAEAVQDRQLARFALLTVHDNGHGIAPEIRDKIFEPFFTTKEAGQGTGLGLAMSYGAIKSHGGQIEVESSLHQGTTFKVYLPLKEPAAIESEIDERSHPTGSGETLLLADDDDLIRNSLGDFLQLLGFRVLFAGDGDEAMRLFDAHAAEIDLAILDLVMPHAGGTMVAQHIRRQGAAIPIIFVTGYDRRRVLGAALQMEGTVALDKPFQLYQLTHLIHDLLTLRRQPGDRGRGHENDPSV